MLVSIPFCVLLPLAFAWWCKCERQKVRNEHNFTVSKLKGTGKGELTLQEELRSGVRASKRGRQDESELFRKGQRLSGCCGLYVIWQNARLPAGLIGKHIVSIPLFPYFSLRFTTVYSLSYPLSVLSSLSLISTHEPTHKEHSNISKQFDHSSEKQAVTHRHMRPARGRSQVSL